MDEKSLYTHVNATSVTVIVGIAENAQLGELTKETVARYFHLYDFDRLNFSEKQGKHNRLEYAVLLYIARYLNPPPNLSVIAPNVSINFLSEQLHIENNSEHINI